MTPDADPSMLAKLLDYAWAVVLGLLSLLWKLNGEQFKDLRAEIAASRNEAKAGDAGINAEVDRHRDVMAKLFDKLDDLGRRSEDRHREVLNALHAGLDRKADKA